MSELAAGIEYICAGLLTIDSADDASGENACFVGCASLFHDDNHVLPGAEIITTVRCGGRDPIVMSGSSRGIVGWAMGKYTKSMCVIISLFVWGIQKERERGGREGERERGREGERERGREGKRKENSEDEAGMPRPCYQCGEMQWESVWEQPWASAAISSPNKRAAKCLSPHSLQVSTYTCHALDTASTVFRKRRWCL